MKEFKLKITEENTDYVYIEDTLNNLYENEDIEYIGIDYIDNQFKKYEKDIIADELLEKFLGREHSLGRSFPNRLPIKDLYDNVGDYTDFNLEGSEDLNEFAKERFSNIMDDLRRRIIHIESVGNEYNIGFYIILKKDSKLILDDFAYLGDILRIKDYYFEYQIIDYKEIDGMIYSCIIKEDGQIFAEKNIEEYMFDEFQYISDSCDKSNIKELKKKYL